MARVNVFHNVRIDGARRTGLTVEGLRALEYYVPGSEEWDPSLLWYFDAICFDESPPETQTQATAWLASHADTIEGALTAAADRLQAGLDSDVPWSFVWPGPRGPGRVYVSAMRSEAGHSIGSKRYEFLTEDSKGLLNEYRAVGAGI